MDRFRIILLSLVILVTFVSIVILPTGKSNDNYTEYFYIGRIADTVMVYGNTTLIKKLVKMNGNWYLYGDTNAIVTNVEMIMRSNVRLKSLVFDYDGVTYEYREGCSESIITNSEK